MSFREYDHIERLGHAETEDILFGDVYITPKLDGTNASVFFCEGKIKSASRRRVLSLEEDNAGFCKWVEENKEIFLKLFDLYPHWSVYSEWLVPHSLKTYREDAWRRSWIFDVYDREHHKYLPYNDYVEILEGLGLDVIPPLCIIKNPTEEQLYSWMSTNTFLIKDNEGVGEGICIKNYDWRNKYGRQVWAKLVRTEFKELNRKQFGTPVIDGKRQIELEIAEKYVTETLIQKTRAKIELECPDRRILIPRLLQTVFYELIREEIWNFIKEYKNPIIDFNKLNKFCITEIKKKTKDLF